jgi:tetraacyldisaccharide 4'-kinase
MSGRLTFSQRLQRHWWRAHPGLLMRALQPFTWLYLGLARWHRAMSRCQDAVPGKPVVVVGNVVVGGAGKTPSVIALVEWLRSEGWTPGVVSRGHGRAGEGLVEVTAGLSASRTGDEPLLIHLRTAAPVVVSRDRVVAVQTLCARHPSVDIVVSDDGLQHHRLKRDVEIVVFDNRGTGNGLTLPAGPLRQPLPDTLPPRTLVLYNADRPSTTLPGAVAQRALAGAIPLGAWWQGGEPARQAQVPLPTLQGRVLLAAAGTGDPERFFRMLEQQGLRITRLPLPDHARFVTLPWPAGTPEVVVTEKDAVKLRPDACGTTRVWVVALDFALPPAFTSALRALLPRPPRAFTPSSPT